jgi:hypothetical protein
MTDKLTAITQWKSYRYVMSNETACYILCANEIMSSSFTCSAKYYECPK